MVSICYTLNAQRDTDARKRDKTEDYARPEDPVRHTNTDAQREGNNQNILRRYYTAYGSIHIVQGSWCTGCDVGTDILFEINTTKLVYGGGIEMYLYDEKYICRFKVLCNDISLLLYPLNWHPLGLD